MKLNPIDVKRQRFNNSFFGFNKEEVILFLERVADEIERLQSENGTLKKDLEEANKKLEEYRKIEKNLQETLLRAYESSSKAVEAAKKQTALIKKEAELKAEKIIEDAKKYADEIKNSVLALREERNLLLAKLKALVASQEKLLDLKLSKEENYELKENKGSIETPEKTNLDIDNIIERTV